MSAKKKNTRLQYDVSELVVVIRAWLGWNPGTSNVERAFSQHQAIFGASRCGRLSRQREQDILTLCADYNLAEVDAIVKTATEIWKQVYFNTRSGFSRRKLDAGVKRKAEALGGSAPGPSGGSAPGPLGKTPTLKRFIAARRRAVADELRGARMPVLSACELRRRTASAWTPQMQMEEDHMKLKRARRLMEVVAGGNPRADLLAGFSRKEIVDLYNADQERLENARVKKHADKRLAFTPRVVERLTGKVIMWEPPTLARSSKATVDAIAELRIKTTAVISQADIVCVADFQHVDILTKWNLYLNGGALAQAEYINTHGRAGACIALAPAVTARTCEIWVSASFAENNRDVMRVLADAVATTHSRWKWFTGSNREFLTRALRVKHLMGIVTNAEFQTFPRAFLNVKTAAAFLDHIRKVVEKDTRIFGK